MSCIQMLILAFVAYSKPSVRSLSARTTVRLSPRMWTGISVAEEGGTVSPVLGWKQLNVLVTGATMALTSFVSYKFVEVKSVWVTVEQALGAAAPDSVIG